MAASHAVPFSVLAEHGPDLTVLRIYGELDVATAHVLLEAIEENKARGRTIVVDLASLEFMDAAGARVLSDATRDAGAGGWSLRVRNVPPTMARQFGPFGIFGLHSLS